MSWKPANQFEQYVVDRFNAIEQSQSNHLSHHERVEREITRKRTAVDFKVWGVILVLIGNMIREWFI